MPTGPLRLHVEIQKWSFVEPFHIAGHRWDLSEVVWVGLQTDEHLGVGEASGVFYKHETPASMLAQIEALRTKIERGITRDVLQRLLPPGGARNALDCALWDLDAKVSGRPAWDIAKLQKPRPLLTTFTCGAGTPEKMAATGRGYRDARALKLKLTGEPADADRVRAVREARPDVWLGVDANQSFTRAHLEALMSTLVSGRVDLIEQPFPIGQEALLDGFDSPIRIAADESVQVLADIPPIVGRFNVINIKLDKSGGLTAGLAMARLAREAGLEVMIGNMLGTSLSMAPAFLIGQLCSVVDLDGPIFLKSDRPNAVRYDNGLIDCPETLWGGPVTAGASEVSV